MPLDRGLRWRVRWGRYADRYDARVRAAGSVVTDAPARAMIAAKGSAPYCAVLATPFSRIAIRTRDETIVRVDYLAPNGPTVVPKNSLAREVCRQIGVYMADSSHRFDLPCAAEGTEFQRRVWQEIAGIPSGHTRTYGELALALGSAPRPVGGACGSNPIPLIIACHRVVAAGGKLGGFMHSRATLPLGIKRWLLQHEGL